MDSRPIPLDAHLAAFAREGHRLAWMLRHPDPTRGTVHTPREIAQQPWLWRHTARQLAEAAPALRAFLDRAGLVDPDGRTTLALTGAGTSDYVGVSVAGALQQRLGLPVDHWPTTRVTVEPDAFWLPGRRYVMVHVARSGNSPESVAVLDAGLALHPDSVRHVVVTCNPDGSLAERARQHPDRVFLLVLHEACNDRGLAMTSSFTSMAVAALGVGHLDDPAPYVDLLDRLAEAGDVALARFSDVLFEAASPGLTRAFFLGNGGLLGAAIESALKLQELTTGRIMAKGEDTLAFRHGPISAVDATTLVGFFLSADPAVRRYEVDVVDQFRDAFAELGTRILVVGAGLPDGLEGPGLDRLDVDPEGRFAIPAGYEAPVAVLVGQMLGLFASHRHGLNVDDPSVDKALYSRTVQGVRIYDAA